MPFNVNKENFAPKGVYKPEDLTGLDASWNLKKTGELKGKTYEVYTKSITHTSLSWKCLETLKVLAISIFSFGLAPIFSKKVRGMWHAATTGKEVRQVKVLKTLNETEDKTDNVGGEQIPIQTHSPRNSTKPLNIPSQRKPANPLQTPLHKEPAKSANPTTSPRLPSLWKKVGVKQIFPSILNLDINNQNHPELFKTGGIFTKEHDRYDNRLETVMGMSLITWTEQDMGNMRGLTGLEFEQIPELDKRFMARFNAYDAALDLKGRLSASLDRPHIKMLQIQDIEAPWRESGLQIALLTDQEVVDFSVEKITLLSERQLEVLALRASEVNPSADFPEGLDGKGIEMFTLSQLRAVPGELLSKHLGSFAGSMLNLLTESQKDQLDPLRLSDDQFQQLYKKSERVQRLVSPILQHCLNRLATIHMLPRLTVEQVKSLNFTDLTFERKVILDGISNKDDYREKEKGKGIRALSAQQVVDCLNEGLFDQATAGFITMEQVKAIDFTKVQIKNENTEALKKIFYSEENLQALNKESLLHLISTINPYSLRYLKAEQIKWLNFTVLKSKEILDGIANKEGYPEKERGKGIRALSVQQVVDCLNEGLFDQATAVFITTEQVKAVDFTKVQIKNENTVALKVIFNQEEPLQALNKESLLHLISTINPYSLRYLKAEQIKWLNFTVLKSKEILDGIANKEGYPEKERGKGIRALSVQQVVDCLNEGLFDQATAVFIATEQVKAIDFTKVQIKNENTVALKVIFNQEEPLQALNKESLLHLISTINPYSLRYLKAEQIKWLNFTVLKSKEILDGIANKEGYPEKERGKGIRALSVQQVVDCLKANLFDFETVGFITDDHLRTIDLASLPQTAYVQQLIKRKNALR